MNIQQAWALIRKHIEETVTPQYQRDRLRDVEKLLSDPTLTNVDTAIALLRVNREDTVTPEYQRAWLREAEELLVE